MESIGAVLWSSPKDVRGVDMGNATLGSPTLAFSLEADGEELEVSGLKTQTLTLTLTLTLILILTLTLTRSAG